MSVFTKFKNLMLTGYWIEDNEPKPEVPLLNRVSDEMYYLYEHYSDGISDIMYDVLVLSGSTNVEFNKQGKLLHTVKKRYNYQLVIEEIGDCFLSISEYGTMQISIGSGSETKTISLKGDDYKLFMLFHEQYQEYLEANQRTKDNEAKSDFLDVLGRMKEVELIRAFKRRPKHISLPDEDYV